MTGTTSQIEWAEQIRQLVNAEFDRVANALERTAAKQSKQDRKDTDAIIAILQQKRLEVMARDEAGYFIHDWQDLGGQVREMIDQDPAFQKIKAARKARSLPPGIDQQITERNGIE